MKYLVTVEIAYHACSRFQSGSGKCNKITKGKCCSCIFEEPRSTEQCLGCKLYCKKDICYFECERLNSCMAKKCPTYHTYLVGHNWILLNIQPKKEE